VPTIVLEKHHTLLPTAHAMVYMPVIILVLRKLGILKQVMATAFLNHEGADAERQGVGEIEGENESGEFSGVLLIGQRKMNGLILEELKIYPCVEVLFEMGVVGIEDLEGKDSVRVTAHQGYAKGRWGL